MTGETIETPTWATALEASGAPYRARLRRSPDLLVWHVPITFTAWVLQPNAVQLLWKETWGKTLIVGADGLFSTGEVEIVRRLRRSGYQAFWVSDFPGRPCERWAELMARKAELPAWWHDLDQRIRLRANGLKAGRPDIVAWMDDEVAAPRFVEYKGPTDSANANQGAWVRAALLEGVAPASYVVARGSLLPTEGQ